MAITCIEQLKNLTLVQLKNTNEVVGAAGDDQFRIRRQVDVRRATHVFPNSQRTDKASTLVVQLKVLLILSPQHGPKHITPTRWPQLQIFRRINFS